MELGISIILGGIVGWIITHFYYKKSIESDDDLLQKVDSILSKTSELTTNKTISEKYNNLNIDTIKIRKEIQEIGNKRILEDRAFEFNLNDHKSEHPAKVVISELPKSDLQESEFYVTIFIPDQEPYVLEKISGIEVECYALDLDNDGITELIITHHCGAHSMGIYIYKIAYGGVPKLITPENLGSDYPSIEWEDYDNDGQYEIKILQRDWENVPVRDHIEFLYKFSDGELKLVKEERFIFDDEE